LVNRKAHRRCGHGQRERWQAASWIYPGVSVGLYQPSTHNRPLHFGHHLARPCVHEALQALGGLSGPAGSCVWHVLGLQRSVREWAMRLGWGGRPVDQKQAQGIWSRRWGFWRPLWLRRGQAGLLKDA
jgi:hypothetical protein